MVGRGGGGIIRDGGDVGGGFNSSSLTASAVWVLLSPSISLHPSLPSTCETQQCTRGDAPFRLGQPRWGGRHPTACP